MDTDIIAGIESEDDTLIPKNWDKISEFSKIPAAELTQTDEALHLKLEVPGMKAEDLDIQVTVDSVSISGERKEETLSEEKGVTHSEFRYGKFRASYSSTCTDSKHQCYRFLQRRNSQCNFTFRI